MKFRPINQAEAEIIAEWHYPGEYSFYDMKADKEDYEEFINPDARSEHTYSVYQKGQLLGFLTANAAAPKTVNIGLGMHPDVTGKGVGSLFLESCLDFVYEHYEPSKITLSVASFNKRAIKVYKRAGFVYVKSFQQQTNGSIYEFVQMEKS
ncbi:GNAT family N-acetyltransferase [Halobacillus shinanisalinarum]|uniref:GNAT family N-acetyltransferase n=1 Tax=Halobacillus shinanisalinarum TaxID=2932258 RepID=A0ABY4H3Z2_9BACI|nr:GNAT family protein [Halobacillus shinanisalinarum]UOQ95172.1 GNAT family N-acetyltransferase [Halobacillus shinanisalinarum]